MLTCFYVSCIQIMNKFFDMISDYMIPDTTNHDDDHSSVTSTDSSFFGDEEDEHIFQHLLERTTLSAVLRTKDPKIIKNLLTTSGHSLIMGFVQSGKSEVMFAAVLFLSRLLGINVIIVVRDFISDADQFMYNFRNVFLEEIRGNMRSDGYDDITDIIPLHYAGDLVRSKGGQIHDPSGIQHALVAGGSVILSLANHAQLSSLNDLIRRTEDCGPMVAFIDEVDDIMYSTGLRHCALEALLARMIHTIGVSATVFDPLHDERFIGSRVYLLEPPEDYKGVDRFQMRTIEPMSRRTDEHSIGRFDRDSELLRVLDDLRQTTMHTADQQHPMIFLIKNERMIQHQLTMMKSIRYRYGRDFTIIVHNGDSTCLYAHGIRRDRDGVVRLPSCHKKARNARHLFYRGKPHEGVSDTYLFRRAPIQDVLQLLIDSGGASRFPRILIVSHDMIGRGINIVSRDFRWHLTHMFYRPSITATVPMMLQSMRLCGRYSDNLPLVLYAEERVIRNILKGHQLQLEIVERVRDKAVLLPEASTTQLLADEIIHPDKIPKKSVFLPKTKRGRRFLPRLDADGDKGWTMNEFNRPMAFVKNPPSPLPTSNDNTMDPNEFHRLTNPINGMFKKWADPTNQSAIARFMREGLDPKKSYTKKEITDLCKEFRFTLSHLMKNMSLLFL